VITTESLHLPQLLNFIVLLFLSFGSITFYLIMITFIKYLKIVCELMIFIGRYIQSEDMKTYPYSTQAAVLLNTTNQIQLLLHFEEQNQWIYYNR